MIFTPTLHRESELDDKFEMLSINNEDGIELEGVVFTPKEFKNTMLFFGGRSHDVVGLIKKLSLTYPTLRIISFNYRSYGKSEGVASEKNLFKDSLQIASLTQKYYGDFYILGFSLGSSVASYVASKHKNLGVILVGSFDSIASVAKEKFVQRGVFPMIDLSNVFRYKFRNYEHVQSIDAKTYLFVSRDDETTYIQNARNLKNYIKNLALYKEVDGLSHKELLWDEKVVEEINGVIR
ncbi:alpha/beta hydrolase [Sulfurimonas sp.]